MTVASITCPHQLEDLASQSQLHPTNTVNSICYYSCTLFFRSRLEDVDLVRLTLWIDFSSNLNKT